MAKKAVKVITSYSGGARVQTAISLTLDEWAKFKARAIEAGQSVAGRVAWLIRRDLKSQ